MNEVGGVRWEREKNIVERKGENEKEICVFMGVIRSMIFLLWVFLENQKRKKGLFIFYTYYFAFIEKTYLSFKVSHFIPSNYANSTKTKNKK